MRSGLRQTAREEAEYIALIGIDEAGSSSSTSSFGKGAVSQPSVNRSPGDSNSRSDINRCKPLVTQLKDLLVSIQLLSASSDASLLLASRAGWLSFFFR